ncbi:hypothetical protein ACRASQ_14315 [Bacteroides hominis]|uniref:hypothetical protein n=1 Tax=Bacteroides hominis TaxID=2763023 RepID=UPI003D6A1116
MIDYLYYRIYRLWLHSSVAEGAVFIAVIFFAVLLSVNVLTVWGVLVQYDVLTSPSDNEYYILEGSLIALLGGRYFLRKRYKKVIDRYEDENNVQRKAGAWILTLYIVSTFTFLIIEALWRHGKI